MTTIIGIKASLGLEGVVFCSDTQLNHYVDGNLTKTETDKADKILLGKKWMMGFAGAFDKDISHFLRSLTQPKRYGSTHHDSFSIIASAIKRYELGTKYKKQHFPELNSYNLMALRNGTKLDDLSTLLMAAHFSGNVDMWEIDEFGNLKQPQKEKEIEYLAIGSSSSIVDEYFERLLNDETTDKIDQSRIDIPTAIDLAVGALDLAENDPDTSGMNIAVLTKNGAREYGHSIRAAVDIARKKEIESIKRKYR